MVNPELLKTVILFGASLAIVPLFKKFGLGSVLGYLVTGFILGPFMLDIFHNPESIVNFAEIGVVMFLFIIGLEMDPTRLWNLKKDILGFGFLQVLLCCLLTTFAGVYFLDFTYAIAFVVGAGFTLSSTAIIMSVMDDRKITNTPKGQRVFSTLLFEDLSIVPLLAIVAFLSPKQTAEISNESFINSLLIALGGVFVLVLSGKWLLNPLFRMIGKTHVKEMMTVMALFVVLSSALLMEFAGLSMAMGAFVAGVMLSESKFKHQLEVDIEPFKGLLLGLFFMGVGMSLNVNVIKENYILLLTIVGLYVFLKAVAILVVAKVLRKDNRETLTRMILMSHGGEFAFVLFNTALTNQVIDEKLASTLTAAIIISMVLSPLWLILGTKIKTKIKDNKGKEGEMEIVSQEPEETNVLLIGLSNFSQTVAQTLVMKGLNVTIIDKDMNKIQAATRFGFNVYYGDGTNPNVLHACKIHEADLVLVGTDSGEDNLKITHFIKTHYPLIKVMVMAKDRYNAIELVKTKADYHIREAFESALTFSKEALILLGEEPASAELTIKQIRQLDKERFNEEVVGGAVSSDLAKAYMEKYRRSLPEPLVEPSTKTEALDETSQQIVDVLEKADQLNKTEEDLIDIVENPLQEQEEKK